MAVDRATDRINVRCTPAQLAAVRAAAAARGVSVSEYMLDAALTVYPDTQADELARIARDALAALDRHLSSRVSY